MEHTKEFFDAMVEHCKQARRVPLAFELQDEGGRAGAYGHGAVQYIGRACVQVPFRARWLLIEKPEGLVIRDVTFGAWSKFPGCTGAVPASLYAMADALKMTGSPVEAWKRFEIDSEDALHVGEKLTVHTELEEGATPPAGGIVRCLWVGDEPKFRKWEAEVAGTIHEVSMGAHGPLVTVHTRAGDAVRVPIKPSDIPYLMNKIGKAVKFTLETGDDR
jgi:hypothetical protein